MAEEHGRATVGSRRSKYLPEELQENILVCLLVKSLIRFKLVCKTWLFTFYSRCFIDLHDQHGCGHSNSYPLELHTTSAANLRKMIPGLMDRRRNGKWSDNKALVLVLGPVNGFYCLTSHLHGIYADYYSILTGKIALCNPATHDYKYINPFPCEFRSLLSDISANNLAKIHFGFGIVNNNSVDYRVVVLIHYGCTWESSFIVFVYSVQRGAWENIVDYVPAGRRNDGERTATEVFNLRGRRILYINNTLEVCPQRFFQGCYYWLAYVVSYGESSWDVLSFDFADQSFKLIGGPSEYRDYITAPDENVLSRGEVFMLHDRLIVIHLFSMLLNNGVKRIVEVGVWMMMEYGDEESWTKISTIKPNFDREVEVCNLYGIHYQPRKSGGIHIKMLVFKDRLKKQIISCDDAGNEVNNVSDPEFKACWNTPGISTYVETPEGL